jgi:hypothetical protein
METTSRAVVDPMERIVARQVAVIMGLSLDIMSVIDSFSG